MMKMREMAPPSPQAKQEAIPDFANLPDEALMELLQMLLSQGEMPEMEEEDDEEVM